MFLNVKLGECQEHILTSAEFVGELEIEAVSEACMTAAVAYAGLPAWLKPSQYEHELPKTVQNSKRWAAEKVARILRDPLAAMPLEIVSCARAVMKANQRKLNTTHELSEPVLWLPDAMGQYALERLVDYSSLSMSADPLAEGFIGHMVDEARLAGVLPELSAA